jgi:hypothetical protein
VVGSWGCDLISAARASLEGAGWGRQLWLAELDSRPQPIIMCRLTGRGAAHMTFTLDALTLSQSDSVHGVDESQK